MDSNRVSGEAVTDLSGNSHTGVLMNSPTQVSGIQGQAYKFDGSTTYMTSNGWFSLGTFTSGSFSMWVKPTTIIGTSKFFLGARDGVTNTRVYLFRNSGDLGVGMGTTGSIFTVPSVLAAGNWYYLTLTWNPTTVFVYINGKQVGSAAYTENGAAGTNLLSIGTDAGNTNDSDTTIDDVRFYTTTLTQSQISEVYYSTKGGYPLRYY